MYVIFYVYHLTFGIHGTSLKALIKYSSSVGPYHRDVNPISFDTLRDIYRPMKDFKFTKRLSFSHYSPIENRKRSFFTCSNDCIDSRVKNAEVGWHRRSLSSRVVIQPLKGIAHTVTKPTNTI